MRQTDFIDECHRFMKALTETVWSDDQINKGFTGLCHGYATTEDSRIVFAYMQRCREKYERWIQERSRNNI